MTWEAALGLLTRTVFGSVSWDRRSCVKVTSGDSVPLWRDPATLSTRESAQEDPAAVS